MISVIVPIYNDEPYLKICIDSILSQTYKDIEIILIDDGSTDGCPEIIDEYEKKDNRIRVFHNSNMGLSASRNYGLRKAKGDYICFIDSDDWIEANMLDALIRALEETDSDISTCGFWIDSDANCKESHKHNGVYVGDHIIEALIDGIIAAVVWNKLYKREVLKDISFPDGRYFEDLFNMPNILYRAKRMSLVASSMYHYRVREKSITKRKTSKLLVDYADANIMQFEFIREKEPIIYNRKKEKVQFRVATGLSRLWRWWYFAEDKELYIDRIKDYTLLSKNNIPLFGYSSWPIELRLSTLFTHSSSQLSFAVLYFLNQLYRRVREYKNFRVTGRYPNTQGYPEG